MRGGWYLYNRRFSEGAKNLDAATRPTGSVTLPVCHDRETPERLNESTNEPLNQPTKGASDAHSNR